MEHQKSERARPVVTAIFWSLVAVVAALVVAGIGTYGTTADFELYGLPVARGTLNQCTAILVTCIALVVPLTSNLYSPRLVRPYVTHPLLVTGLSVLLGSQLLVMALVFVPRTSGVYVPMVYAIALFYLLVIVGALPFLWAISQFLRPQFFMPMLAKTATRDLRLIGKGKVQRHRVRSLFEGLDVMTNIALTGMNRGDRQLVLLALQSLREIFVQIIGDTEEESATWRRGEPFFVPGLAREGRNYLVREGIWPEAYVIGQMLKIMESANVRQQEILAELAAALLDTALMAFLLNRGEVFELHVMTFNSMMADAIQEKNLRKFQNLSYYYRLLVEAVQSDAEQMLATVRHLVHYGKVAHKQDMHFARETVVYDLGELVLNIAREDEDRALELLDAVTGPQWIEAILDNGLLSKVGWRCLVRVHWEAQAAGLVRLAGEVRERHLSNDEVHAAQIDRILGDNRELHTEFNDRLMRFAWVSPPAEALARAFTARVNNASDSRKKPEPSQ